MYVAMIVGTRFLPTMICASTSAKLRSRLAQYAINDELVFNFNHRAIPSASASILAKLFTSALLSRLSPSNAGAPPPTPRTAFPSSSPTPSAPSPTPSSLFLFYSKHQAARQFQFSFVRLNSHLV
jgi:hypothetical protein